VDLDEAANVARDSHDDVLALDEALTRLEAIDQRQSQIVELQFFGGLSIEEIAEVVKLSPATVKRELQAAKLWLHRIMTDSQ
jgi:RNA polymerase sigma factor (sigma-70 family)